MGSPSPDQLRIHVELISLSFVHANGAKLVGKIRRDVHEVVGHKFLGCADAFITQKRSLAPAAPSSMSSGWAPTTSTRSVMGTDTGPLSKERSKIRRATAMMRTISAIS